MINFKEPVLEIGKTNYRNRGKPFGIKVEDRRLHTYIIGKTGTGKSTLIQNMVLQDIQHGHGLVLMDPHGDLVERVLERVPGDQLNRVRYFNVPDSSQEFGFNPLATIPESIRPVAASGLLSVFKKLWEDSWGPRLEHILRNAILVLIDHPDATLADIPHLLNEKSYRVQVARTCTNDSVREFWLKEYEKYPVNFRAQAIAPIQNKVGAFLAHGRLRSILSQPQSTIRFRAAMDAGDVILINLAKGRLGEDAVNLLGSMLVSTIAWTALTRATVPEPMRRDFFVYLDECQTFATPSLIDMMAELRKYRVSLTLAHQHLAQLSPDLREAILGNVGSILCFRIGPPDAGRLALQFGPEFDEYDLTRLPNYEMYVRMMLDGMPTPPFSAVTSP
jgi:hypothetical protein